MEVPTADLSSNIAEAGIAAAASDDRCKPSVTCKLIMARLYLSSAVSGFDQRPVCGCRWAFMVVLRALTADCQKASESGARGISDSAKALVILANGISPAASHYYPLQLLADLCNLHNILAIGLLATSSVVQAHNNQRRDAAVEVLRNLAAALNAAACRAMQSESAGPPSLRTNVSEDEGLMKVDFAVMAHASATCEKRMFRLLWLQGAPISVVWVLPINMGSFVRPHVSQLVWCMPCRCCAASGS